MAISYSTANRGGCHSRAWTVADEVSGKDLTAQELAGMERLRDKYPNLIKEIRGRGLLTAMELKRDEDTAVFAAKVKDLGATVSWTMNAGATVRVSPPLVITKDQIGQALEIFDKAFASLNK